MMSERLSNAAHASMGYVRRLEARLRALESKVGAGTGGIMPEPEAASTESDSQRPTPPENIVYREGREIPKPPDPIGSGLVDEVAGEMFEKGIGKPWTFTVPAEAVKDNFKVASRAAILKVADAIAHSCELGPTAPWQEVVRWLRKEAEGRMNNATGQGATD